MVVRAIGQDSETRAAEFVHAYAFRPSVLIDASPNADVPLV